MALRLRPTFFSLTKNTNQHTHRLNVFSSPLFNSRQKHYLAADSETFKRRLNQHDGKLVIVDFYADWCGPCRVLSPTLEKITSNTKYSNGKEVDLFTIDTDAEGELAVKYKVSALPTVIALRDGQVLEQFVGAQPPATVESWIKRLST
ncbi:hypothetical protein FRC18_007672 [Serendipita sp. 400]|nr:hypothetical protein FRC18_007672 [Serendipita sp. 400]